MDDQPVFSLDTAPVNEGNPQADTTPAKVFSLDDNPPVGSILSTSLNKVPTATVGGSVWSKTLNAVGDNLSSNFATAGQPALPAPVASPFFAGIPYAARHLLDRAAEKVAAGGDAVLGDAAKNLPGYKSSADIGADIDARAKAYADNPDNAADSVPAMLGRGTGTALASAGPLSAVGRSIATLLDVGGATAYPTIARALEYLGGTAKAAPDASRVAQLATRGASLAAQGGTLGGGTAAVDADPKQPFLPQVAEGAASGAVAGPAIGAVGSTVAAPFKMLMGKAPGMVNPNVLPLADRFINDYKIGLDPTQLSQNPTYKIMMDQSGKLPFSGAADRIATARGQWQQNLAGEMGEKIPASGGITAPVMNRAINDRIGPGIGAIADRTTILADHGPDGSVYDDMGKIGQAMDDYGLTDAQRTPIQAISKGVLDAFSNGNGQISGKAYRNLTQTNGPIDTHMGSDDPTVAGFAGRIRNALDDAFSRSAAPGDVDALNQLRYQYRVAKTIQPLVAQKGATGDIDPNSLLQRVIAQSNKFDTSNKGIAYTGGGKLGEWASGGQLWVGRPPDSGTAARIAIASLLGGGNVALHNPAVLAGTAGTLAANRVAQSVLRSPVIGRNMIENSLNPQLGPTMQRYLPAAVPGLLGALNNQ